MDAKLLDACVVLLGPQARRAGQSVLRQLTVATVRSAFRRLALRTHPDRARGQLDGSLFVEASRAYELLMAFLLARRPLEEVRPTPSPGQRAREARPHPSSTRSGAAGTRGAKARADRAKELFYHGPLPRRRLRLAEFLYYSGCISWQSLIRAVVWQRTERPKFGEIARQLRIVSASDMTRVLLSRARHEQIGAAASRLRLLTAEEVKRILRIQRAHQRLIGRYFVEMERMTDVELSHLLHELFRHNAHWRTETQKSRSRATV